ncbi:MAG: PQQ-binding-like beta-propeller repeat protein [Acidobacteriota bacterium]|nr:PQQ-binding-like beta-propeller repeat protein [Acidobacteriota bacterium]
MLRAFTFISALLLTVASATAAGDNSWPGFRGAKFDGHAAGSGMFTGKKEIGLKLAWKIPIGSAYSGVAVAEGMAVTLYADGDKNVVGAFDVNNGRRLWQYTIGPIYKGHDGSHDGPIATPAIADGRVFGLDPYGNFFALDAATGKQLWHMHMVDDLKASKPRYGFGGSPLVVNGKVIVMVGGEDRMVMAFHPETGEKIWGAGSDDIGYPTPGTWSWDGRTQLIAGGTKTLVGIDPEQGRILWSHEYVGEGERGYGSMTPVPMSNGRLFLGVGRAGSKSVAVARDGENFQVIEQWSTRAAKNSYTVPVYHDGYLYAYSTRIFTCIDPETGEAQWKSRQPGDGFLAVADDHLVVATKSGALSVGKASPDGYQEKARLQVFDKVAWTLPAISGNSIYVRGFDSLARVDVTDRATAVVETRVKPTGSVIAELLKKVEGASDKQAVVDDFIKAQKSFPLIEGKDTVHFIYRGEAEDVAVAGHFFGARQERSMTRIDGTNTFYTTIKTKPDAMLAYLFIKDYNDHLTDPLNKRGTEAMLVGEFMEFNQTGEPLPMSWFAMPEYKAPGYLAESGEAPGKLVEHEWDSKAYESKVSFKVYLPAGYDSEKSYPVAYVTDPAAWDRGAWKQALTTMGKGKLKPFITVFVGIPAFDPRGSAMIVELVSMVDSTYKTIANAEGRTLVGFGYTGGAVVRTIIQNPDMFSKGAMQSGFYMGNNLRDWDGELEKIRGKAKVHFFVDWGTYDMRNPQEEWDMSQTNPALASLLKKKGFKVTAKQYNQGTDWTSWRSRTGDLLAALFAKGS